jgi:hypothetical protein
MRSGVFVVLAVLAAGFGWAAGGTVAGAAEVPPVVTENARADAAGGDIILVRNRHHSGRQHSYSRSGGRHSFSHSGSRHSFHHRSTPWRGGHHHRRHHRGFYSGPYIILSPYAVYSYGDDEPDGVSYDEACYSNCRLHRGPRYCAVYCAN